MARLTAKLTSVAIALLGSFFLAGGIVSAQSITNTGPDSTNVITFENEDNCEVENNNNIDIENNTWPKKAEPSKFDELEKK